MRDNYELRLGDEPIAQLHVIDAEFPWMSFKFIPLPAFAKMRSLFIAHERFWRHHGRIHKKIVGYKRGDCIWQKLLHKGLNFVDANTGERAEWFFVRLHVRRRQLDARFVFTSWLEKGKRERAEVLEKYAHLLGN